MWPKTYDELPTPRIKSPSAEATPIKIPIPRILQFS
jgi:hypothetical protein